MGWGYALLGYHPEVISRSFSAHLMVKLVKSRDFFSHFLTLLFRQLDTNYEFYPFLDQI